MLARCLFLAVTDVAVAQLEKNYSCTKIILTIQSHQSELQTLRSTTYNLQEMVSYRRTLFWRMLHLFWNPDPSLQTVRHQRSHQSRLVSSVLSFPTPHLALRAMLFLLSLRKRLYRQVSFLKYVFSLCFFRDFAFSSVYWKSLSLYEVKRCHVHFQCLPYRYSATHGRQGYIFP